MGDAWDDLSDDVEDLFRGIEDNTVHADETSGRTGRDTAYLGDRYDESETQTVTVPGTPGVTTGGVEMDAETDADGNVTGIDWQGSTEGDFDPTQISEDARDATPSPSELTDWTVSTVEDISDAADSGASDAFELLSWLWKWRIPIAVLLGGGVLFAYTRPLWTILGGVVA